jgi:hypothetical protein
MPGSASPSNGSTSGLPGGCTPSNVDISEALGFSVSESISLHGSTTYFVPTAAYARVSAYPVFQKISWDIVSMRGWSWGAGSVETVVVGSGVVLKPIGVYFATDLVYDWASMGGGVVGPGPILNPTGGTGGSGNDSGAGGDSGTGSSGGDSGSGGSGGDSGSGGTPGTSGSGGR